LIYLFGFITHIKVAKIVLSGDPGNNQPFGNQAKGLILIFLKKEGFLKNLSNDKIS